MRKAAFRGYRASNRVKTGSCILYLGVHGYREYVVFSTTEAQEPVQMKAAQCVICDVVKAKEGKHPCRILSSQALSNVAPSHYCISLYQHNRYCRTLIFNPYFVLMSDTFSGIEWLFCSPNHQNPTRCSRLKYFSPLFWYVTFLCFIHGIIHFPPQQCPHKIPDEPI